MFNKEGLDMKYEFDTKLKKIIYKVTSIFFIIFVIMFSVLSLIQSSYTGWAGVPGRDVIYTNLFSIKSAIYLVVLIILIILINKCGEKPSSKKLLIIEMIIFAVVGFIYCMSYVNVGASIDSFRLYEDAKKLFFGDYSVIDSTSYIGVFPQNLGLFSLYYLFIKIFNNSTYVLTYMRIFNLIFSIIGYVYLYKITDILYKNNKINLCLLLLFVGFNHLLLYSVYVYTNVLGYSLAIISIYYLIYYFKNDKRLILSFIFIVLSIIIRKNSLIILIAEIITLIFNTVNIKKISNIIFILLFCIAIFTPNLVEKYYESKYNVIYNHHIPTISYVCYGMNYSEDSPGRWVGDFEDIFFNNNHDEKMVKEYASIYIDSVLDYFKNNPLKCIKFYIEKFICTWCDHKYDVFTVEIYNEICTIEQYEPIMNDIYDAFLSLMSIGLIVFVIRHIKNIDYEFIIIISIVGGFIFHFFWESQAIYSYQYVLLLLPLSAYGLNAIINRLTNFIK